MRRGTRLGIIVTVALMTATFPVLTAVAHHNSTTAPPESWSGTLQVGTTTLDDKGECDPWDACPLLEGIAYENIRVGPTLEGENSSVEYVTMDIYNTIPTTWWRVCAYDENHTLLEDECDETDLATYRLEGETIPPETEYVRLILRNSVDVDWWFRVYV